MNRFEALIAWDLQRFSWFYCPHSARERKCRLVYRMCPKTRWTDSAYITIWFFCSSSVNKKLAWSIIQLKCGYIDNKRRYRILNTALFIKMANKTTVRDVSEMRWMIYLCIPSALFYEQDHGHNKLSSEADDMIHFIVLVAKPAYLRLILGCINFSFSDLTCTCQSHF